MVHIEDCAEYRTRLHVAAIPKVVDSASSDNYLVAPPLRFLAFQSLVAKLLMTQGLSPSLNSVELKLD